MRLGDFSIGAFYFIYFEAGQGPAVLQACACETGFIFFLIYPVSTLSTSLWEIFQKKIIYL